MSVAKVLSCCLKTKVLLLVYDVFIDVFGLIDAFINYINYLRNLLKLFGTVAGETMY